MPELTNPRAERVASVRALVGRSARSRSGRFLVEGPQGVREAIHCAPEHVRDLYVTLAAAERYAGIVSDAVAARVRVHTVAVDVLEAMSGDAQGVLAVLDASEATLTDVLATRPRLVAVLARVRDPGNAGSVIRAADAAGADAVLLTEASVDVHNPKVVRSTAGSLFHLPVVTGLSLVDAVTALRSAGLAILAADGSGDYDLDDLLDVAGPSGNGRPSGAPDLSQPTAWVFGNEAWGLPEHDRALSDAVVRVPIRGRAESLNLATAATVCLYASARAQR
ncbi:MAG: RNA methyltransferase [Cellulomonas sp.]|uniref:TrmH family RNA methyltransferase n=1 Tax=Cellulomonas sp. TaxID=40001 RepID=UPI0017BE92E6|nr:RNA methyltransferase [Cellulomonas sp.]NMM16063.1 RNA methyltransferase [Cellulomonas sp.]NMM29622.1 RNA methyltransferase [Cellulomonas sp.]